MSQGGSDKVLVAVHILLLTLGHYPELFAIKRLQVCKSCIRQVTALYL